MKFTSKTPQYQINKQPFPTYFNSYVRDGKIQIGENSEYLEVDFLFCHTIDEIQEVDGVETTVQKEVVITRSSLRFTESHTPTYMTLENGERVEVYEAILMGEFYDKNKIADGDWGMPSLEKAIRMFDKDSLTNKETGLVIEEFTQVSVQGNMIDITSQQSAYIKQLMTDWLEEKVMIENEKLGVNFELDQ